MIDRYRRTSCSVSSKIAPARQTKQERFKCKPRDNFKPACESAPVNPRQMQAFGKKPISSHGAYLQLLATCFFFQKKSDKKPSKTMQEQDESKSLNALPNVSAQPCTMWIWVWGFCKSKTTRRSSIYNIRFTSRQSKIQSLRIAH